MKDKDRPLKLFTGNANRPLAESVAKHLGVPLGDALVGEFSDGEVRVRYNENVRGCHVVIFQPMDSRRHRPGGRIDSIMELKLLANDARGSSAGQVTGVIPYFGYARQDRKDQPRVPISVSLVVDEIQDAGFHNVMLWDLHSAQIQGLFKPTKCVADHLYARLKVVEYFQRLLDPDPDDPRQNPHLRLIAPDVGATRMVNAYADRLNVKMDACRKVRNEHGQVTSLQLLGGEVEGCTCVLIDDTVDTATTLTLAANALVDGGASRVFAFAVHPILSGSAQSLIEQSPIERLFVTDTLELPEPLTTSKIQVITLAPFIAEAIRRNHQGESISSMLD